jgi:hypothetical protein
LRRGHFIPYQVLYELENGIVRKRACFLPRTQLQIDGYDPAIRIFFVIARYLMGYFRAGHAEIAADIIGVPLQVVSGDVQQPAARYGWQNLLPHQLRYDYNVQFVAAVVEQRSQKRRRQNGEEEPEIVDYEPSIAAALNEPYRVAHVANCERVWEIIPAEPLPGVAVYFFYFAT